MRKAPLQRALARTSMDCVEDTLGGQSTQNMGSQPTSRAEDVSCALLLAGCLSDGLLLPNALG